jgi:hypothetical protein
MTPTTDDRTRQWVLAQRALFVGFLLGVITLALIGVEWWLVLLVLVPLAMAGSWMIDPRRPWWGTEPMATMTDPDRRKAWRRTEVRFGIAAFIVIVVVVPAVLVFSGVASAP